MACQVRVHGKAVICGLPQTQASSVSACWTLAVRANTQSMVCGWNTLTLVFSRPSYCSNIKAGLSVKSTCVMEFSQISLCGVMLANSNPEQFKSKTEPHLKVCAYVWEFLCVCTCEPVNGLQFMMDWNYHKWKMNDDDTSITHLEIGLQEIHQTLTAPLTEGYYYQNSFIGL